MSESESHGENLIFILSQPRAGSTLLQRILGNHPDVHTVAEPWILLHPIYALRYRGHWSEFNNYSAYISLNIFFKELPGGEEDYYEGMRRMFSYLYERAKSQTGKTIFLDKTPRYYLIIPELLRLFPNAHYIFLFRNPLAVLSSILLTWRTNLEILLLSQNKQDLVSAPPRLVEGIRQAADKGIVVHYEELVRDPAGEIKNLCEFIGLNRIDSMTDFSKQGQPNWQQGDHSSINHYTKPEADHADKWVKGLNNPQVWRLTNDYLQLLGREFICKMGYSFDELHHTLGQHKPNRLRLAGTLPLNILLGISNFAERGEAFQRGISWVIHSLSNQGLRKTFTEFPDKVKGV